MKPILITLLNSESFILYNKELNNLFDELEDKLISSEGADFIHLSNSNEVIPQLNKVLPKSLDVLTITRETIILGRESAGLVVEKEKFFSPYYINNCKKYTIKLL